MLYFSKVKVEIDSVDLAQYQRLKDFKHKTYPRGLVESYSSLLEFRDKFSKQLAMKIRELISRDAENREEGTGLGPTTDIPEIGLALVHVATYQHFKPGGSPRVESVVCSDIEEMSELLEGSREGADSDYLNATLDYLKELGGITRCCVLEGKSGGISWGYKEVPNRPVTAGLRSMPP